MKCLSLREFTFLPIPLETQVPKVNGEELFYFWNIRFFFNERLGMLKDQELFIKLFQCISNPSIDHPKEYKRCS